MVGAVVQPDANAEIDLPFWRNIEIDNRHDLMLLLSKAVEVRGAAKAAALASATVW